MEAGESRTCLACGKVWPHPTPIRSARFVCGDCCRVDEISDEFRRQPDDGVIPWVIPSTPIRLKQTRFIDMKDEQNPRHENGVRAIEDAISEAA